MDAEEEDDDDGDVVRIGIQSLDDAYESLVAGEEMTTNGGGERTSVQTVIPQNK